MFFVIGGIAKAAASTKSVSLASPRLSNATTKPSLAQKRQNLPTIIMAINFEPPSCREIARLRHAS